MNTFKIIPISIIQKLPISYRLHLTSMVVGTDLVTRLHVTRLGIYTLNH